MSPAAALAVKVAVPFVVCAAGIAAWIVHCVAVAMRGPADIGGCPWCRPLGRYADISILPSDCECDEACDAPWCQRYPVTR